MEQLLAHLVGDYVLQSHWMATKKTEQWLPAVLHGITYTLPFLLLTRSVAALLVICVSHIIIDHYRLAKVVARIKNWTWTDSGYPDGTPDWLWVWLMIITDNTMHLVINHFALKA